MSRLCDHLLILTSSLDDFFLDEIQSMVVDRSEMQNQSNFVFVFHQPVMNGLRRSEVIFNCLSIQTLHFLKRSQILGCNSQGVLRNTTTKMLISNHINTLKTIQLTASSQVPVVREP